jgi:hypothetical protein
MTPGFRKISMLWLLACWLAKIGSRRDHVLVAIRNNMTLALNLFFQFESLAEIRCGQLSW